MREFERIERIMALLKEFWSRYPELRFNQLIDSLQWEYVNTVNNKYLETYHTINHLDGKIKGFTFDEVKIPELFYLEDDQFEKFLLSKVK